MKRVERERWKAVVGYEGYYEVSSIGRVRRILRDRRSAKYRYLALAPDDEGRPRANLCVNYERKNAIVSGLVAAAFIGPRPDGLLVCHEDGDNANNRVGNLRYGTQASNMQDAVRHGTACLGEKSSFCRITADVVRSIRAHDHLTLEQVAIKFKISVTNASNIRNRKTWKHI